MTLRAHGTRNCSVYNLAYISKAPKSVVSGAICTGNVGFVTVARNLIINISYLADVHVFSIK